MESNQVVENPAEVFDHCIEQVKDLMTAFVVDGEGVSVSPLVCIVGNGKPDSPSVRLTDPTQATTPSGIVTRETFLAVMREVAAKSGAYGVITASEIGQKVYVSTERAAAYGMYEADVVAVDGGKFSVGSWRLVEAPAARSMRDRLVHQNIAS